MEKWLERLDRAKREREERDRKLKATELDRESRAREKRQQEIFLIEQEKVRLRTDLARFEPETLLLSIKQKVWEQGSLKEWEFNPIKARSSMDAEYIKSVTEDHREHSLWYVAMGLVYEYADLIVDPYTVGGYTSPYKGTSTLALVIGVGIFYPNDKRKVFLYNEVPYDTIWGKGVTVGEVSYPSAHGELQDVLLKQAFAVTPSEAEKTGRERLKARRM